MKKLTKILVLVLACAMLLGVLSACQKTPASGGTGSGGTANNGGGSTNNGGGSSNSGGSGGGSSNSGGSGGGSSNSGGSGGGKQQEEPYQVDMFWIYPWTHPTDEGTKGVEDAVSARVQSMGYNYTLKLHWINLFEYDTQVDMMLAAGDKADIIFSGLSGMANKVDNGYLIPLDPYLNNEMADAVELLGDWMICGKLQGKTFILPCRRTQCVTYCYIYIKDMVDAINYDMSQIQDFYDIEDLFAHLKAVYPTYRMDVDGSRYAAVVAELNKTAVTGTYAATVGDDPTLVNYFKTDAWKSSCDYAYRFRMLGYTNPDGSEASALTSEGPLEGMQIGIIIGYGASESSQGEMYTNRKGYECGSKKVCVTNLTTVSVGWGVSYTSKNPSAAATLLNLMWTDQIILNTIMYGVEGRDYVFDEDGLMKYPDGLDGDTVPYQMGLNSGVFADMFAMYPSSESARQNLIYTKELLDNAWVVPLFGFTPANDEISTEVAAVSNVYNQYHDTLVYGDFDPAEMNPTFLDALETAGIDIIIDSYNEQAQAWLNS